MSKPKIIEANQSWINVKDELPEIIEDVQFEDVACSQDVYILMQDSINDNKTYIPMVGCYTPIGWKYFSTPDGKMKDVPYEVTYWMKIVLPI